MENKKRMVILSVIIVLILIGVAIGLSYAYFATIERNNAGVDVETEITTQSNVIFNPGESIELVNAEPGAVRDTEFDISLKAPNKTADSITYNIIWNISENDFEFTDSFEPQLTYSLYYRMSEDAEWIEYIVDQDCTTVAGKLNIISGAELKADIDQTTTTYWKFRLEYKSFDYDQSINMGKVLKGKIELNKEGI